MSEIKTVEAKSANSNIWPTEIRVNSDKNELTVGFTDGEKFTYSAEYLRVVSPSAEVQGHSASERVTVPGKKNVKISNIEKTGNYAIRIIFDDRHDTGIFSWDYLHLIGREQDERWNGYLQELAEKGLTR